MRELKFRIRDSGIMHHSVIVGTPPVNPSVYVEGRGWVECTEEAVVVQYTGLKDINGREIYEGDIVEYENGNAGYGRPRHEEINRTIIPDITEHDDYIDGSHFWVTGEIIGNVHEHPELLEGK